MSNPKQLKTQMSEIKHSMSVLYGFPMKISKKLDTRMSWIKPPMSFLSGQPSPVQVTTVIVHMECIFYLSWQCGYCLSFQVQAILGSKWEQSAMWLLTWWQHQQSESIGWVKRTIERRHHYFQRQSRLDGLQAGLHSFVELHVHFWFISLSLWFKIYMELSTANQS